jgi:hypothetical protein
MSLGAWEVKVSTNFPQKVATGIAQLDEQLIGAEYDAVAYLGSQVVNGTNHAVLAQQTILTGRDTKNAVVLVFNEKPKSMEVALASINTIVKGNNEPGGIDVNVTAEIPAEAKAALDAALKGGFVGSKVEAFAYIGKQVTKGIDYIFACEVTPVTQNPVKTISLVKVHSIDNTLEFKALFSDEKNNTKLGYAFTW